MGEDSSVVGDGIRSESELVRRIAALAKASGWPDLRIACVPKIPRDPRSGTKVDYRHLARLLAR